VATITTSIDLNENAFSFQTDSKTGKQILNLSINLVENYGLENVEFEQILDATTGETTYRMKPVLGKDGKAYEVIIDPTTGSKRDEIYFIQLIDLIFRTILTSQRNRYTTTINNSC
jgi:predicted small secreted protein